MSVSAIAGGEKSTSMCTAGAGGTTNCGGGSSNAEVGDSTGEVERCACGMPKECTGGACGMLEELGGGTSGGGATTEDDDGDVRGCRSMCGSGDDTAEAVDAGRPTIAADGIGAVGSRSL